MTHRSFTFVTMIAALTLQVLWLAPSAFAQGPIPVTVTFKLTELFERICNEGPPEVWVVSRVWWKREAAHSSGW